jgi:hypothetical protein
MKLGRPPLGAVLPLLAALVIMAGWTVFWVQASNHAAELLAQWRAEQARKGTQITCSQEDRGGYPFQFTFTCTNPVVEAPTSDGLARVEGRSLRLVALVYDPTRFIAELDGPVIASRGRLEGEFGWTSARMSIRVTADPSQPEWRQSDIIIQDANLTLSEFGQARAVYSAPNTELHLRKAPGLEDSIDAAISAQAPQLMVARGETLNLDTADLITRIDNVPAASPGGLPEWLVRWQANDGAAELTGLRITSGDTLSRTSGTLRLDERGYPQGNLVIVNANGTGKDDAAMDPDPPGLAEFIAATVGAVGVPVEIEGRQGKQVDLRLERGRVHLGPMAIMPLPRLIR